MPKGKEVYDTATGESELTAEQAVERWSRTLDAWVPAELAERPEGKWIATFPGPSYMLVWLRWHDGAWRRVY